MLGKQKTIRNSFMSSNTFQLSKGAAQSYEGQKVPAIFRPMAVATVNKIRLTENDKVLDVACGTGIILRVIGERVPNISRLVGSDLNESMLDVAKNLTEHAKYKPEWHQGAVSKLPFEAGSFSKCFCQQGLQYFPDKVAALKELRRVLMPNGTLIITVWSDVSPFIASLSRAFGRHVSTNAEQGALAPFAFRDKEYISRLIAEAGYKDQSVQVITANRILGEPSKSIPSEIAGIPVGKEVASKGPDVMARIVQEVSQEMAQYRVGEGFAVPQSAYLFEAKT